ncbi:MAG TPA: hypothetical protein VM054_08895 [bacterium]|nr:hypothetical protein [bacterium]
MRTNLVALGILLVGSTMTPAYAQGEPVVNTAQTAAGDVNPRSRLKLNLGFLGSMYEDYGLNAGIKFTWGANWYGGLELAYVGYYHIPPDWDTESVKEFNSLFGPGFVGGYGFGGIEGLGFHVELAVYLAFDPSGEGVKAGPAGRMGAGMDFALGGGWGLSADLDFYAIAAAFGVGVYRIF